MSKILLSKIDVYTLLKKERENISFILHIDFTFKK